MESEEKSNDFREAEGLWRKMGEIEVGIEKEDSPGAVILQVATKFMLDGQILKSFRRYPVTRERGLAQNLWLHGKTQCVRLSVRIAEIDQAHVPA